MYTKSLNMYTKGLKVLTKGLKMLTKGLKNDDKRFKQNGKNQIFRIKSFFETFQRERAASPQKKA